MSSIDIKLKNVGVKIAELFNGKSTCGFFVESRIVKIFNMGVQEGLLWNWTRNTWLLNRDDGRFQNIDSLIQSKIELVMNDIYVYVIDVIEVNNGADMDKNSEAIQWKFNGFYMDSSD